MFNLNVPRAILCARQVAATFGDQGGAIVNIGSNAATETLPTTLVYTATKGAVDMLTRTLAKELGPRGIRVNSVNPGLIETEGTHASGVIGSDFERRFARARGLAAPAVRRTSRRSRCSWRPRKRPG